MIFHHVSPAAAMAYSSAEGTLTDGDCALSNWIYTTPQRTNEWIFARRRSLWRYAVHVC